jgi:hypothetical protein
MTKLTKAFGPSRRGIVKAAGALAAGIAAPALLRVRPAYAAYPDRTVKIVVANTPGGPSDIVGRLVAAGLQQSTGKTFIIENHGGAGGNIGMEYAARSEPDGYTILLATNAYSINYGLYNAIPYDPFKDFVPVCELGGSPNIFVVKSDLPAKTMAATPSKRCSPAPCRCARARWRRRSRTSNRARCAGLRSAPTSVGPICRTCLPRPRPATRISPLPSTPCYWRRLRRRRPMSNGWKRKR